jgi:3',5'-cyclic AMP phosphodiesterase CpdA
MHLSPRCPAIPALVVLVVAIGATAAFGVSAAPTGAALSPAAGVAASSTGEQPAAPDAGPIGDTLTVIQRPLLNIPSFVLPGGEFTISCEASVGATGWAADLVRGARRVALTLTAAVYEPSTHWWRLTVATPTDVPGELYDLRVHAAGGIDDVTRHAVKVLPAYRSDYYFIHITDPHLPTHMYYYEHGAAKDSTSLVDLREVINDINIINPEFVLLTGDVVNEGDLEDYLLFREYTRAQRVLGEFQVPVFLTSGNHDVGGYLSTPVPIGTGRRNWWRFFGWKRLASPPSGAPARTQDYSFDYGPVHYVGLEAYLNYDGWQSQYYGSQSFVGPQLQWLNADLAAAVGSASQVLFYHDDFGEQLDLGRLGAEMALYGHIHHDSGSLTTRPYNLATGTTADGLRTYRVIRVSNGVVTPLASVSAGSSGEALRVAFSAPNDGTRQSVRAVVTNGLPLRFENARLRFLVPKGTRDVDVDGGTLLQTDDSGPVLECLVGIDLAPSATQTVEVRATGESPASELRLAPTLPNPFQQSTVISYDLPSAGRVVLTVFAPDGRVVTTLVDEDQPAGSRTAVWDGFDAQGLRVPSGTYFCRLVTPDGTRTGGLTLVREGFAFCPRDVFEHGPDRCHGRWQRPHLREGIPMRHGNRILVLALVLALAPGLAAGAEAIGATGGAGAGTAADSTRTFAPGSTPGKDNPASARAPLRAPLHGGVLSIVDGNKFETVFDAGELQVYLYTGEGAPAMVEGATGKALVKIAGGKSVEVPLVMEVPAGTEPAVYFCPMHPNVVQMRPGICEECGGMVLYTQNRLVGRIDLSRAKPGSATAEITLRGVTGRETEARFSVRNDAARQPLPGAAGALAKPGQGKPTSRARGVKHEEPREVEAAKEIPR